MTVYGLRLKVLISERVGDGRCMIRFVEILNSVGRMNRGYFPEFDLPNVKSKQTRLISSRASNFSFQVLLLTRRVASHK